MKRKKNEKKICRSRIEPAINNMTVTSVQCHVHAYEYLDLSLYLLEGTEPYSGRNKLHQSFRFSPFINTEFPLELKTEKKRSSD